MKMFIPEIGNKLVLSTNWTFWLFNERRNDALIQASNFPSYYGLNRSNEKELLEKAGWIKCGNWNCDWKREHTLPSGTILTVDRIYIRKGVADYSSVSFNIDRKSVNPTLSMFTQRLANTKGRCRFWAKLDDVNNIEFTLL